MGFGHRVYKNYDPRAKIIKQVADQVFEVTGRNPLLDIALELERIALQDDYFIKRKLYPNVDFYSGIIYEAMGFPMEMFPVLFAIPRTSGGSLSGRKCLLIPSKRSPGHGRSIWGPRNEFMQRWNRGVGHNLADWENERNEPLRLTSMGQSPALLLRLF